MTVDDVRGRLGEIRELAGDDEAAHGREDRLYIDVLTAIAAGECDDPKALAAEALQALEIDFSRWCA